MKNVMRTITVLLFLFLIFPGCRNSELGVTWLEDSSGFVFSTDAGKIIRYDINEQKSHVLVSQKPDITSLPAVSPGGDLVAFAKIKWQKKDVAAIQIVLCDLQGNEKHASKTLEINAESWLIDSDLYWEHHENDKYSPCAQLIWNPAGHQILLSTQYLSEPLIYDIKTNTFKEIKAYVLRRPWRVRGEIRSDTGVEYFLPFAPGTSPVRPDGKGFLLCIGKVSNPLPKPDPSELYFVTWDGKSKAIKLDFQFDDDKNGNFWLQPSEVGWDGNKAFIRNRYGECKIDTDKLVATLKLQKPKTVEAIIFQRHHFANKSSRVEIIETKRGEKNSTEIVVNYFRSEDAAANELFRGTWEAVKIGLFPSPNKKLAVLRATTLLEENSREKILLINSNGKILWQKEFPVRNESEPDPFIK